jgi:glycolate oxidase iron-sulfur subunit
MTNNIIAVSSQAARCVKCGTCLTQCPVYSEALSEITSPRGKLSLVELLASGEIQFTKKLGDILSACLLCDSCGESCPNQVKAGGILLSARKELVNHRGLPAFKKLLFGSLQALPRLFRTGSLIQGLLLKKIPGESGLHRRFPLPFLDRRRFIPPIAAHFFSDSHTGLAAAKEEKMRVGYFPGCVTNYLFPRIGTAALRLLNGHGVSVMSPPGQTCCGLMAFAAGDWTTTKKLALANIEAFEKYGLATIITTCASCAAALKVFYPRLFEDADQRTRNRIKQFSDRVTDISRFLASDLKLAVKLRKNSPVNKSRPVITYHDPCHLKRTLGIHNEPREILKALPNFAYTEMPDASRCCGMGGTFSITHYDLSMSIVKRKLDSLESTAASLIATSCSGCLLQLMDGIHQRGLKARAIHLVEAISC